MAHIILQKLFKIFVINPIISSIFISDPNIVPSRDEMKHHRSLSLALFNAMEDLGATIENRNINMEAAISREILYTIAVAPSSLYVFGSQYEGTYTEGLQPDIDGAMILPHMPVITDIANCPSSNSYLLVPDEQPGYVSLQLVHNGDVQWEKCPELKLNKFHHLSVDINNRVCLVQNSGLESFTMTEMHRKEGPAIHKDAKKGIISSDLVVALSCSDWPKCARKWLSRRRIHGWPSKELIKQCKSLGFIGVSACHPASDEKQFQWRISFSHQERLLVTQFNSVQLKCYILLKIIKKELIKEYIKEDTLTSYHLKTCMLYILENTPSELWVPENLVGCLIMCLRQIHLWIRDEKIPNYFIPGENMLDRITKPELRRKLAARIDWILNCAIRDVLYNLQTDNIGFYLRTFPIRRRGPLVRLNVRVKSLRDTLITTWQVRPVITFKYVYQPYINCLRYDRDSRIKHVKEALVHTISDLAGTRRITIHTEEETQRALSIILPFLHLSLLSCEIVQRIDKPTEAVQYILKDKAWFLADPINSSAKIKQASALLMLGYQKLSLDVLSSFTITENACLCVCSCPKILYNPDIHVLVQAVRDRQDITPIELLRDYSQPCVHFFPHEQQITPVAVNYEMIRSYITPLELLRKQFSLLECYLWGVVDGHFLQLFLLYLNHRALGQNSRATKYVKKMIRLLNSNTVCHRETCLNLLGYVHRDRGEINRAVQCFIKSLETNPLCNAAYWHLCFLICKKLTIIDLSCTSKTFT